MKQAISWFLVFMIVFSCASLLRGLGPAKEEPWENPYVDVTQDLWSYHYGTEQGWRPALQRKVRGRAAGNPG